MVRVENLKFVSDIGDVIKHNILQATPTDLIFLIKGAHYLRNFKHTTDVYSQVHARALSLYNLRQLEPAHIKAFTTLYDSHQIITDSPFVTTKVERPL